jgi:hypothetical protein
MLSLERIKELMADPSLSDEAAEEVRDHLRMLAEVIFEKWCADSRSKPDEDVSNA